MKTEILLEDIVTKEDFEAKLALKQLERRTRLIRQATLTPFGRSKVYSLLWVATGVVAITFFARLESAANSYGSLTLYVIFGWLVCQILLAKRRINALVELLQVEKLWQKQPDDQNS